MLWTLICVATLVAVTPVLAQTRPATSGKLSFHEPEMRRHHSGFHRPNAPHRHHRRHGYHRGFGLAR